MTATTTLPVEPVIFSGIAIDQRCGHGDIVSHDGHTLRATPRLLVDNSNYLERLPESSRVDIIDCRLWTDSNEVDWLAVRTAKNKLGWMIVQPDKFYVTLYPIHLDTQPSLTGVPAGGMVAYTPPTSCTSDSASNQAVVTSIGIDLIPVVGDMKGLQEAATGCDSVTGESLGDWRWLGLLGIIGLSEVALLRHSDEVVDGVRLAGKADEVAIVRQGDEVVGSVRYADDAAIGTARHMDDAGDVLRGAGKANKALEGSADVARVADGGRLLPDEAVRTLAKFEQPCSFSGDTPVLTTYGSVRIQEIRPGDMVLAYDEATATTGYYTVTNVFAHRDTEIVALRIGQESIVTTPEHPFRVDDEWVAAGDLSVGDRVTSASDAAFSVQAIRSYPQRRLMYNLTVAEAHTYYVGEGEWLVHNACSRILRRNLDVPKEWETNDVAWQAHHIIPGEYEKKSGFVKRAIAGGFDIDGANNGIGLPYLDEVADTHKLPSHRGYHSHYSADVGTRLDELEDTRGAEGWTDQRSADELQALADQLRKEILNRSAGSRLN